MSGLDHPNMEHYAYEQAPEFNHYLCKNERTRKVIEIFYYCY